MAFAAANALQLTDDFVFHLLELRAGTPQEMKCSANQNRTSGLIDRIGARTRLSLMPGNSENVRFSQVRFTSLHNFCPLPVEVMVASPDCYQLFCCFSEGTRARRKANFFKQLILPNGLSAPFVVLHLGQVKMRPLPID